MAIDGGLLFAGHWLMRQQAISSRIAYALMGGVMAAIGYAIAMRNSVQLSTAEGGTVLSIGLLPTIAGMLSGFLYGQFAGLALAPGVSLQSREGVSTPRGFDGPVRVRTSFAGIAIAATMPAVLTTVFSVMAVTLLPSYFKYLTGGPGPVLTSVIAAAIPFWPSLSRRSSRRRSSCFACTIARALRHDRAFEYAVVGGAMALVCGFVLSPLAPLAALSHLLMPAMTCGAIMGVRCIAVSRGWSRYLCRRP